MSAQFTPGPWYWHKCFDPSGKHLLSLDIVPAGGHSLTGCAVIASVFVKEENANLIAAAPDLYRVLANAVAQYDAIKGGPIIGALEAARAVLAKARGEQ